MIRNTAEPYPSQYAALHRSESAAANHHDISGEARGFAAVEIEKSVLNRLRRRRGDHLVPKFSARHTLVRRKKEK